MTHYAAAGVPVIIEQGAALCFHHGGPWTIDTLKAHMGDKVSQLLTARTCDDTSVV